MAKTPKTNPRDIITLETYATTLSIAFGLIGGYTLGRLTYSQPDYLLSAALTWSAVHTPILINLSWRLRAALGEREATSVSFDTPGRGLRSIPWFGGNNQSGSIFATLLPIPTPPLTPPLLRGGLGGSGGTEPPQIFTVWRDGVPYTWLRPELHAILTTAWRRQRNGQSPLPRSYFCRQHRPRLTRSRYDALTDLLAPLLTDRSQGRTGRLIYPPLLALAILAGPG